MGTPIKINKGLKANLPKNIVDGQINFCTDTGELYIDNEGTRTIISSTYYGESTTMGSTTTKAVKTIDGFSLKPGVRIIVKFKNNNTVPISNLDLEINDTGLKKIVYSGTGELELLAGVLYDFIYDGKNYVLIGDSNIAATYATKEELLNKVVIRRWD